MWNRALNILAFVLGIIAGDLFNPKFSQNIGVFEMIPLLVVTFIIGFLPSSVPNYLIVPATSFGLAMQEIAFQKVEGLGYGNIFTSGNKKKTVPRT